MYILLIIATDILVHKVKLSFISMDLMFQKYIFIREFFQCYSFPKYVIWYYRCTNENFQNWIGREEGISVLYFLIITIEFFRLMLGFMLTTMFLSMWISNTATTAMMVPIISAVMNELNRREEGEESSDKDGNFFSLINIQCSTVVEYWYLKYDLQIQK